MTNDEIYEILFGLSESFNGLREAVWDCITQEERAAFHARLEKRWNGLVPIMARHFLVEMKRAYGNG